jgi:hypothetical protein
MKKVSKEAVEQAFLLMLAIPVTVIDNHYGKLQKKEGRCERFTDMCLELYESFEKGQVTLDELKNNLYKQTGITIEERN